MASRPTQFKNLGELTGAGELSESAKLYAVDSGDRSVTMPVIRAGILRNLPGLSSKLALINGGATTLAKIVTIGDSISDTVATPNAAHLWSRYGHGGIQGGSGQAGNTVTIGSGVESVTGDFASWITGAYSIVGAAETITWTRSNVVSGDPTTYERADMGTARVFYRTEPGAGTFKVQKSSNGSSWTDIGTIDANASSGFAASEISLATAGHWQMRVMGVSGEVKIINVGWRSTTGVHFDWSLSLGGSTLHDYLSAPSDVWAAWLTASAPDLVIVEFWDDPYDTQWLTDLRALQAKLYAAVPNADIVYIIQHPVGVSYAFSAADKAAQLAGMVSFVGDASAPGNKFLWDASSVWGTYDRGNALGMYLAADDIHLSQAGKRVIASAFARDFGMWTIPSGPIVVEPGRNVNIGSRTLVSATFGTNNSAVGYNALQVLTIANQCTAFGSQAGQNITTGESNTLVGFQSGFNLTTGVRNTMVGNSVGIGVNHSRCNFFGYAAGASVPEAVEFVFVSGHDAVPMKQVFFGSGYVSAVPEPYSLNGTGGLGTNIAGAGVSIAGGKGTGTGSGGDVNLQVAVPSSSGATLNALVTKLQIRGSDGLIIATVPTSNPAVAGALWNDAGTLKVSAG